MNELLQQCIDVRRQFDNVPTLALGLKLSEEVGEFSETVLKACGFLRHKEVKETPFGEAADVINVVLGILGNLYPENTSQEIVLKLKEQIDIKKNKYERIMREYGSNT